MKIKANAKLNLYLEVTGKKPDGYHELESMVVFLDLADEIEIKHSEQIKISGTQIENNIILKTANLLREKFGVKQGAEFYLNKNIPTGAGLGGGSADSAAALFLLNKFWNLDMPDKELYRVALELGADVPVCLYSILENKNTALFSGIGEDISPAPILPPYYFLLVGPNKPLATKDVFSAFKFSQKTRNTAPDFFSRRNDLSEAAIKLMPEISEILELLALQQNCLLTRMTGSGSVCFGVFNNLQDVTAASLYLSELKPAWFVKISHIKNQAKA